MDLTRVITGRDGFCARIMMKMSLYKHYAQKFNDEPNVSPPLTSIGFPGGDVLTGQSMHEQEGSKARLKDMQ